MGKRNQVMSVVYQFSGQHNHIGCPRIFIDLTGDHISALVLNQIIFWSDVTKNSDGWFYKSAEEWHEELAISRFQLNRAIAVLKRLGVETHLKKANAAPTLHYRLDQTVFVEEFLQFIEDRSESNSKNDIQETAKSIDFEETDKSITDYIQNNKTDDDDRIKDPTPLSSSSSPQINSIQNKTQMQYTADQWEAIHLYQSESKDRGKLNARAVADLVAEYGLDWFTQAYTLMRQSGKTANHLNYVKGILVKCKAENHPPMEGKGKRPTTQKGKDLNAYKEEMQKKLDRWKEENE